MVETSLLSCGYIFREELTSSFHGGLGKGLQEYGKNSAQTAAIDDIQTTVSNDTCNVSKLSSRPFLVSLKAFANNLG